MRRSAWTVLVCSFALQLFTATNADAWWEFVAALSGPKLQGPHFDGRVVCFMERRTKDHAQLLKDYAPDRDNGTGIRSVIGVTLPCLIKLNDGDGKAPEGYRRRFSIDFGLRYHWDSSFEPANGNKVNFFAVAPMFTWYPIRRPTRDFLDVSAGMGVYWFVSNAFPYFNGRYFDARIDLHVPTVIRRISKWTVLLPTGRLGVLDFPSGFEANAFADTRNGFTSKPMAGLERAPYIGFFFDLDALVQ